ncbi:hypothetical protein HGRIS_007824 [Hohenbuehelia grisea]|uniref:Pre-rRNA-processing protein n=1 Tax=Hohenbuehelia grisea TaxID=104357 RepID=A0ABR3J6U3_9AGAR
MPKSAKKRKDKAADFAKAKLKLGKGKQTASNVIDTSFKARSIALPNQSIASEKPVDEPTTKRRLTFRDLVSHVKHYNAGTRKDALQGFKELLELHPELIESCLATLITTTSRLIGDEDASVRKALHGFYTWLLPNVPRDQFAPHAPMLLLFTTSAQTHIFPEIRVDAIRFLNILLQHIPEAVVEGWEYEGAGHGRRVLEGYLGVLNAGTTFHDAEGPVQATSTASVVLKPSSKLVILESLSSFLNQALSTPNSATTLRDLNPSSSSLGTWYLASSFTSLEAYQTFDQLLQPSSVLYRPVERRWVLNVEVEEDDDLSLHCSLAEPRRAELSLQQLSDIVSSSGQLVMSGFAASSSSSFVTRLSQTLHPTLISTFLDHAPSVFTPNGLLSETDVQLVLVVANIARSLYSTVLQDSLSGTKGVDEARNNLRIFLGYMATYFPFQNSGPRDIKVEEALLDLNVVYCELTSLLVLSNETAAVDSDARKRAQLSGGGASFTAQTARVCEYVTQVLRGEATSEGQIGRTLSYTAYLSLLPTIWTFLNSPSTSPNEFVGSILSAMIQHAINLPSKSVLKRPSIEFIARITLIETDRTYRGHFNLARSAAELEGVTAWLSHLPKTLWELGSSNLPATEVILRFILRLIQRASRSARPETITPLRAQLVPFFSVVHPTRGRLPGPYAKLPQGSALRRLAIDVAVTIGSAGGDEAGCIAMRDAVTVAVEGTAEESYWATVR